VSSLSIVVLSLS